METGYYRLEHSYYSRGGNKYHGRSSSFHLSAVQNYHANKNRAKHIVSINLPDDRFELYSALLAHSNTIKRKNTHLSEGLLVCFDKRMTSAHREEAIKNFAQRATLDGRIKAYVYEHAGDPNNPHAHMQIIDAGEDGKPVAYFGRNATFRRQNSPVKGNPTEWLRKAWEEECNIVLEQHGYDFRIDRRSNLDRGLAKAAKHRGWQATQSPELPVEKVEIPENVEEMPVYAEKVELPEIKPCKFEQEYLDGLTQEEKAELSGDYMARDKYKSTAQRIEDALDAELEFQRLRGLQSDIAHHREVHETRTREVEELQPQVSEASQAAVRAKQAQVIAEEHFDQYRRRDGSLKGWEILGFKFPKRRRAEHARAQFDAAERDRAWKQKDYDDLHHSKRIKENEAASHKMQMEAKAIDLVTHIHQVYGDDATLKKAEYIHVRSVSAALSGVEPQQVMVEFETGTISPDEAKRALELMGELELAEEIDRRRAKDIEYGLA